MSEHDDHHIWTLSNGLDVVFVPDSQVESVYVSLTGKVGRRAERNNEIGAAHFLEHLFFDGTGKHPSALEVNRFIESVGGTRNGFTSSEEVGYYGKVIKDNVEHMFDFVADIFQNSLLEEFEKERKVIAQEAAAKRDDPLQSLIRQRLQTAYPEQPMGRTIFDDDINLSNMTPEIVHAYHQRTYVADNFILGIAGKIDADHAQKLAETYFASIKEGEYIAFEPTEMQHKKTVDVEHRDIGQSKLAVTFKGVSLQHDMRFAVTMLRNILGVGSSSRLYNKLRHDMNIVYYVATHAMFDSDTGLFSVITFMDETNLQKTCDVIIEEIQELLNSGLVEQELERAKNMYLSGTLFNSETPEAIANRYTRQHLLTGEIQSITELIERVQSVTSEDVMKAARQVFSDQPKVNIITLSSKEVNISEIRTE